jgi:nitrogen fixation/metabolism regulation signal transduction histidine kinase
MVFNSFRIIIIARTLLLTATIFLFFYLFFVTNLTLTLVLVGVTIVVQIFLLIRYVDRTNRVLNNFLESIRYSDFTKTFQVEGLDSSFDKLKNSFNQVIKDFQAVRAEKEEHFFYLQTVIQHIGIALIAFQRNGKVELINNATRKLFQVRALNNIESLREISPELFHCLITIKHGENALVRIREKDDLLQLSIYATEFNIHNRSILLVSIKNIQQELDEKEMESWQKLIQVLTHEIMNSIAPISSLSQTVSGMLNELSETLKDKGIEGDETETLDEVNQALRTIYNRTDGLMHFVHTYRDLTKIPQPVFSIFTISQLFDNVMNLMTQERQSSNIVIQSSIEPATLELSADEKLIEQVLINLVKNAIQAMHSKASGLIELKAFMSKRGRIVIQVSDNGQGIEPHVLEKIFIPFFTTKQQGSGIGLSLSRQILRLHGGTITAYSEPGVETKFTLTF